MRVIAEPCRSWAHAERLTIGPGELFAAAPLGKGHPLQQTTLENPFENPLRRGFLRDRAKDVRHS